MTEPVFDLLVLTADKHQEAMVKVIWEREYPSLSLKTYVHPNSDPGCRTKGVTFLRDFQKQTRYALLILDLQGSGFRGISTALEDALDQELQNTGWKDRARCVVIDPESEIWLFPGSTHLPTAIHLIESPEQIRIYLREAGFWPDDATKPGDPKRALEMLLRKAKSGGLSTVIFRDVARHVSLARCQDRAFLRFSMILKRWFGPQEQPSA